MNFEEKRGIVIDVVKGKNQYGVETTEAIGVKFYDEKQPDWYVTVNENLKTLDWEDYIKGNTIHVDVLVCTPENDYPDCYLLRIAGKD
jgi:hypothetical protein